MSVAERSSRLASRRSSSTGKQRPGERPRQSLREMVREIDEVSPFNPGPFLAARGGCLLVCLVLAAAAPYRQR